MSLLYLLLAILGLGFLIFIHELGHYWMARRVGMRVESFGIGFGKPIFSFMRDGVKWNICWLPFGGYVKIAGMEKEQGKEPEEIKDGFFGKSPWDRIKVAVMGPLVNIVFALILFFFIWITGGRDKHFAEITGKIGWIDPHSELFQKGVRPGDVILRYDGEPVKGAKDHFHAAMTGGKIVRVDGMRWDAKKRALVPFSLDVHPYAHPQALEPGILTTGVLSPASFIYFPKQNFGTANELPKGSPLEGSGIQHGDRIVWVDGEPVYSLNQLSALINDNRALVTIKRGNSLILRRVPRVLIEELKLNSEVKEELTDWQYEANVRDTKFQKLFYIPYNLTPDCKVQGRLSFIDHEKEAQSFPKKLYSEVEEELQPGDAIIALDGAPIDVSYQLLSELQNHKVLLVVERTNQLAGSQNWKEAEKNFDAPFHSKELEAITMSIGAPQMLVQKGNLYLLNPVQPKTRAAFLQDSALDEEMSSELEEEKKHIQAIDDPEKRAQALTFLEARERQLLLGLPGVADQSVRYNPGPITMFCDIIDEIVHTLSALVGGYLNPKWVSGPIGIVQVIHHQWMAGIKEALFWIGAISLNLGFLNLLPLPVLDGGYICLSIFEMVTGKRLKSKTIEKIVVPFAVLLISFLIFLTYHDLIRLLSSLIKW